LYAISNDTIIKSSFSIVVYAARKDKEGDNVRLLSSELQTIDHIK